MIVLLDLGLPDADGLDLLRRLRENGVKSPVIVMTARDQLADRVRGLDGGADDYMVKPVALSEVEARIRAQLRRHQSEPVNLRFLTVVIDDVHRQALVGEEAIRLTAKEYAIP